MKVLYDFQAFTYQYFGGVSKCFCELINHRPTSLSYDIAISQSNNEHLWESKLVNDLERVAFDVNIWHKFYAGIGNMTLYKIISHIFNTSERINKRKSIEAIIKGDYDIFHPTFFDLYFLPYLQEKPFVITIHDMMPELFGISKAQIRNKPILCEKAAAIVAVSENTKYDLCRILQVPEDKVHVIYHGGPQIQISVNAPLIKYPYFLFVGTREAKYKNFRQTVIDFSLFSKQHPNVYLVCTGSDFNYDEIEMFKKMHLSDRIIHMFATEKELSNLYSNAIAFIYPSLYEGFGMPILEAFSHGCPVLINNKSCFPEIASHAALYFDSEYKKSNLYDIMELVFHMTANERNRLIQLGYERLKKFSWEKASLQLNELYMNIINK